MIINNIEIVSFEVSSETKSLSGICKVDASYDDGVSISEDIGQNFQMHAFISDSGDVKSRADKMTDDEEIGQIWAAVSKLSKATLLKSL